MPVQSNPSRRRSAIAFVSALAFRSLIAMLLAMPPAGPAAAQGAPPRDPSPNSDAVLVSDVAAAEPGKSITVAVRLTLDPGWHTYWINPGDAGKPLKVNWTLPAGVTAGALQFPTPHLMPQPPLMSYGYENEVFVLTELQVPANAAPGTSLHIAGKAEWLACADICLPASGPLSLDIPVRAGMTAAATAFRADIAATREAIPTPAPGWVVKSWNSSTGYILAIIANGDAPVTSSPYFFVDSDTVLEHAKPQGFARRGDTLVFALPRAEIGGHAVTALRGVVTGNTAAATPSGYLISTVVGGRISPALRARAVALLADSSARTYGGAGATVAAAEPEGPPVPVPGSDMTLLVALAFAFVGGLILNLMPCVFPVLSVKVLALLEHGGATDPSHGRRHGLAFGTGVLLSFWILAGGLMLLRAGGERLGWGFQLQSPPVVALLALLMFALGLNLSGVFEIGLSLTRLGAAGRGSTYRESMLTGGLAVLVAAPCTAPFMGAALGYALVQPAMIGLMVFTSLAVGLALPFAVLASAPRLLRFLPRPGPWLETLKQLFAFPLYATVVWLLWVYGQQVGIDALAVLLLAMIVLAIGAWLWARGVRSDARVTRIAAAALMLLAASVAAFSERTVVAPTVSATVRDSNAGQDGWEPWSPQRVSELRAQGRPIFIDFTAAWCLSCQVNERVALRTSSVVDAFARGNVALLRADWTSRDDEITQVLASFGRSGVPLYVLYPSDKRGGAAILPAVLTPGIVVDAVTKATSTSVVSGIR